MMRTPLLLIAFLVLNGLAVQAQEWTRFRGPNGAGVSDVQSIPTQWTENDYNWKIDLPGIGHASPVVWGENIFIHSADAAKSERYLMCVVAGDGGVLWKKTIKTKRFKMHRFNSLASSTPAVDADHVYVSWLSDDQTSLRAFDHQGKFVWEHKLGRYYSRHGFATSPIVVDDIVIFNNQQHANALKGHPSGIDRSFILGLDRETGKVLWQTPRDSQLASHSVPCLYTPKDGPVELIVPSKAHGLVSFDPKTGKENWSTPDVFRRRTITSPIMAGGLIFGSNGSGGGGVYAVAIKPGDNPGLAYEITKHAPYVPTPVAKGDLVFLWADKGIVSCLDAPSGKVHWSKRVGGNFFSSPIIVGDKLYCSDRDGKMVVLAAESTYQLIAKNSLGDGCHATPAIAHGRMYIRTFHHLMSLGK